jgi:hypothetical protein
MNLKEHSLIHIELSLHINNSAGILNFENQIEIVSILITKVKVRL